MPPIRRRIRRTWLALAVVASALVFNAAPVVLAHTGFESSSPADGEIFDSPVDTVTVVFTAEAKPVGDQFVALDASGQIRLPTSVATDDDKTFVLSFDPPLADGNIGVRWEVQAGDAHPIEGAFSFMASPAPATTIPATVTPATTTPSTTTTSITLATSGSSTPATTDVRIPTTTKDKRITPVADAGTAGPPPSAGPDEGSTTLEEFLTIESTRSGEGLALTGRIVGYLGVVLALGGLAFLALTFRGTQSEVALLFTGVRILGVGIAIGAMVEYIGVTTSAGGSLATGWMSSTGFSTSLRLAGGLALAAGDTFSTLSSDSRRPRTLSAAVLEAPGVRKRTDTPPHFRWNWQTSRPAVVAFGLIVASFWFDGHTVSKGLRPLHAAVNSIHLIAGSVWAGGVTAMAVIVWRRRRLARPTGAAELVIRFSSVASVALATVASAGALMAVFVLDSVGALTSTEWGKTLMLKTSAVAIAAALGAYNHFRLLPKLRATPHDEHLVAELRSSLVAEAIIFAFVVVVTAWLVASAA